MTNKAFLFTMMIVHCVLLTVKCGPIKNELKLVAYINASAITPYEYMFNGKRSCFINATTYVAIEELSKLVLVVDQKTQLIRDFHDPIVTVDVKWFLDRIYVLTRSANKTVRLYEVDLNYRLIVLLHLHEFQHEIQDMHLSSKPLSGFVAYIADDEIYFISTYYFTLSQLKANVSEFDYVNYTNQKSPISICKLPAFGQIKTMIAHLNANDFGPNVYLISKSNETLSCTWGCACNNLNETIASKLIDTANSLMNTAIHTSSPTDASIMQHKTEQECLRKCYMFTEQEAKFKLSEVQYPRFLSACSMPKTPQNLGEIALTKANDHLHMRLKYTNYQLNSCKEVIQNNFNFNYNFFIYIKTVSGDDVKTHMGDAITSRYDHHLDYERHSTKIFDTELEFTMRLDDPSFVEVYMQSPFEVPKRLETFFINTTNLIGVTTQQIIESPLYLSDYERNFIIKHYSVDIRMIVPSYQTTSDFYYLLVNQKTNVTSFLKIVNTTLESEGEMTMMRFSLENLTENTLYKIRILKNISQYIMSMSNLVEFRTLKLPELKLADVSLYEMQDTVSMRCHQFLRDYDSFYDNHFPQNDYDSFICKEWNYSWTMQGTNTLIGNQHDLPFDYEVPFFSNNSFDTRYFMDPNEDTDEMNHVRKIQMKELSQNTNYVINLKVEYSNGYVWQMEPKIYKTRKSEPLSSRFLLFLGLLLIIAVIFIFFYIKKFCFKRKPERILQLNLQYEKSHEYFNELKEDFEKLPRIEKNAYLRGEEIQSGTYGVIYKGILKLDNCEKEVACKVLKLSEGTRYDMMNEALMLAKVSGHKNIVTFYGVSCEDDCNMMLLEYADRSDLQCYLKRRRYRIDVLEKLEICMDIAEACVYLESKRIVHRDLAARNCLVFSTRQAPRYLVVKVGDFGLAREFNSHDSYKFTGRKPLPIRWMSPESIIDNIATTKSDVWSFGVLVWEVFSGGFEPWQGCINRNVVELVKKGETLNKTCLELDEMKELVENCWKRNPNERFDFQTILTELQNIYKQCKQRATNTYSCETNNQSCTNSDELSVEKDEQSLNESPLEFDGAKQPLLNTEEETPLEFNSQISNDSDYVASETLDSPKYTQKRLWSADSEESIYTNPSKCTHKRLESVDSEEPIYMTIQE